MKVLRIKDWNKHFETAQSRKIQNALPWFAVPTKHDGKGFRKLMRHENGVSLYGAWILIAAVSAKSPIRGYLIDIDGPLTADDISLKTDAPIATITEAVSVLVNDIGWMEEVECSSIDQLVAEWERATTTIDDAPATRQNRTRHKSCSRSCLKPGNRSVEAPERLRGLLPPFDVVTLETLSDVAKLRQWFLASAAAISLSESEPGWECCCAAALQACSKGMRKPPHVFQKLLRDPKGRKLINAHFIAQGRVFARQAA